MKGSFDPTKSKWKKILAAALLLGLGVSALVFTPLGSASPLRQGAQVVSQPFLRLFSAGDDILRQISTYAKGLRRMEEENQALADQVAALNAQAQAGKLAQGENARLRSLLDLKSRTQDLTLTDAWMVSLAGDTWHRTAALDRGTEEGIQPGQWVIDAAGNLVGQVAESGSGWADLTLVTDPALSLAGQGTDSEKLGQVTGLAGGTLQFTPLGEGQLPGLGETVVTFSQGRAYPAGLLLGTVTAHKKDSGGLVTWAELTPAADLTHLGQVFVILSFGEESP